MDEDDRAGWLQFVRVKARDALLAELSLGEAMNAAYKAGLRLTEVEAAEVDGRQLARDQFEMAKNG